MKLRTKQLLAVFITLLVIAGLYLLWTRSGIGDKISPKQLAKLFEPVRADPLLPLYLILAYPAVGVVVFVSPHVVTIAATLLSHAPLSTAIGLVGSCLSASVFFWLGRLGGRRVADRVSSERFRARVASAGVAGVIAIRLFPVLPYTVMNMLAGALGVSYPAFLLGTAIGMAPWILLITLVGERALAALTKPTPATIGSLVVVVVVVVVSAVFFARYKKRQGEKRDADNPVMDPSDHQAEVGGP